VRAHANRCCCCCRQKRVVSQEVATQTGYSLVGLLHLYHDYVLYKATAVEEPLTASQQYVSCRARQASGLLMTRVALLTLVVVQDCARDARPAVHHLAHPSACGGHCGQGWRRRRQMEAGTKAQLDYHPHLVQGTELTWPLNVVCAPDCLA